MKFNDKEISKLSFGPTDLEGRFQHKRAHKSGFKERWFKLKGNLLFYHNINEVGQIDSVNPSGVIVLEDCNANLDLVRESCFAFSIVFRNEPHKRHIFCGQSEFQITLWIGAIKQASYEYWRSQLILLQQVLCKKTGEDPLLMYPRNRGVIRNRPWENKSSFRSHIDSLSLTSIIPTSESTSTETQLIQFD